MALFETPSKSPVERVSAASGRVASAPGTWVLIGENVDHFGGVTLALSLIHISEPTRPY